MPTRSGQPPFYKAAIRFRWAKRRAKVYNSFGLTCVKCNGVNDSLKTPLPLHLIAIKRNNQSLAG